MNVCLSVVSEIIVFNESQVYQLYTSFGAT